MPLFAAMLLSYNTFLMINTNVRHNGTRGGQSNGRSQATGNVYLGPSDQITIPDHNLIEHSWWRASTGTIKA